MYLVVGLGNPEKRYSKTRHNMGFDVIDGLTKKYNIDVNKSKFEGIYGQGEIEGEKVILLKPQTYMNSSGESIVKYVNFYKIDIENVIVIYDDIDIMSGTIKIRKKGGPGNHNGMKSVVEMLASQDFPRIRVGTGKEDNEKIDNLIEYVIGSLSDDEMLQLQKGVNKAEIAVTNILKYGIDIAMNKLN